MKIAHYLRDYPASRPLNDGMSVAVSGIAGALVGQGADVTVICQGSLRTTVRDPAGFRIERFNRNTASHVLAVPPLMAEFIEEFARDQNCLFVLNGMFNPGVTAVSRVLRRLKVPYVSAPHDPYSPDVFKTRPHVKWPYWFFLEKHMLKGARAVQVLDERHGEFVRRLVDPSVPVIAAGNGVTMDRAAPQEALRWGAPTDPIRILYLGRMDTHNKGLDILLNAVARLPQLPIRLTIQGPDPHNERVALQRLAASLDIGDRVVFLPPDYKRAPPEIMLQHDLFCSPSRFEGFGLSALEAMLSARVLLVSKGAGIASHVRDAGCGVVVDPKVDDVVAGIEELCRRRVEWKEMGLAGRSHVLAALNWSSIARELLDEYRDLHRGNRQGGLEWTPSTAA